MGNPKKAHLKNEGKAGNVVLSSSSLGLHSREPLNTRTDKIKQEFGEYFIGKGDVT